ncbi:MAG: T9SS type A sorting domain-containing protein [Saprospiraceae bacterium]
MKSLYITLNLLIFSFTLSGQKYLVEPPVVPFESVPFDNLNPDWVVHIYDSTFISKDTFDGRNMFRYLRTHGDFVHKGKLVKSHALVTYDWLGFKVSCIDVNSGALLWDTNIDTSEYDNQLVPMYQTFDKNDNVVIIGFRKVKEYDRTDRTFDRTPFDCHLFRLVLNGMSGKVISFDCPKSNPIFKYSAIFGSQNWSVFGLDSLGRVEFLYDKLINITNGIVMKGYIDIDGKISYTDSLEYAPQNSQIGRSYYSKKGGKYYCLESDVKFDNKYFLVTMDTYLNEVSRIDITHFGFEPYLIQMLSYTDEYIIYVQAFPSVEGYNLRHYQCDYEGNLLCTKQFRDDFYRIYDDATIWHDVQYDKLLMTAWNLTGNLSTREYTIAIDVLHYDGEVYKKYKQIGLSKPNFCPYMYGFIYPDDDHIIFDTQFSYAYYDENNRGKFAYGNNTSAFIKVSRKELGMGPVAVEDQHDKMLSYCFPNPSTGYFHLDIPGREGHGDIYVSDISGRNVYVEKNVGIEDISLQLQAFPSGTYLYEVLQNNKVITSGKWIKM